MVPQRLTEEAEAQLKKAEASLSKQRLVLLREESAVHRLDKPSKIATARRLGYKAKPGFTVVRVRVPKGGRRKPRPRSGRRPKHMGVVLYTPGLSRKAIAEGRVLRKHPNMEALGSYMVAQDGKHLWFEVVMRDESRSRG